jgi:hypothetical protein
VSNEVDDGLGLVLAKARVGPGKDAQELARLGDKR